MLASLRAIQARWLVSLVAVVHVAVAQETLFASVAFVRTGERLPLIDAASNITTLTPFGAQQMSVLGNLFRNRYMSQTSGIQGLSINEINELQTLFLAEDLPYSVASTQAFLQALYPPYSPSTESSSTLTNGTSDQFPLGGYQYPWIQTVSSNDYRSIFTDGAAACDAFWDDSSFLQSTEYSDAQNDSEKVFARVGGTLANADLPAQAIVFNNSYGVYDYMSYSYNHNQTIHDFFNNGTLAGELSQLRAYADILEWGSYGSGESAPSTPPLSTIAGQTLALAVLLRLAEAIQTSGTQGRLSLLFGEYPAMLSFFGLADLPSVSQNFYSMPDFASSMMFELFSPNSSSISDTDSLRVRFLFANGTDTIDSPMPSNFTTYPLFNSGAQDMSWNDFGNAMSAIAISDPGAWCDVCDSWDDVPFCMAWNSTAWDAANGNTQASASKSGFSNGLSPTLAGVIGAVVTLAALGLFLIFAVGCCGMRIMQAKTSKAQPGGTAGTRGAFGGFKGSQKLASDPDLIDKSPKTDKHTSGISFGGDKETGGHERVGSWELKQPKRVASQRSIGENEWGIHSLGKEVQPDERV